MTKNRRIDFKWIKFISERMQINWAHKNKKYPLYKNDFNDGSMEAIT